MKYTAKTYIPTDGATMDEHDLVDLRVIELTLQNPKPGTLAASAVQRFIEIRDKRDEHRFPAVSHPITGALCFCQSHCQGPTCECWCHHSGGPAMNTGLQDVTCEREYHAAVQRVFELMVIDPAADTREGEELVRLVAAVERFERDRYPISCCVFASRDCAARLLSVMRSLGAFYDVEHAVQWCETPQPLLDGQRPVDLLITEAGAAEVDAVVARLRDGAHI